MTIPYAAILRGLVAGHRWTTTCDLNGLTPDQRRHTKQRLGLRIDPAGDRPLNLPDVVVRLAWPTLTPPCDHEACGKPQTGPGRPRKGWVKLHQGKTDWWCCSWECAAAWVDAEARLGRAMREPA